MIAAKPEQAADLELGILRLAGALTDQEIIDRTEFLTAALGPGGSLGLVEPMRQSAFHWQCQSSQVLAHNDVKDTRRARGLSDVGNNNHRTEVITQSGGAVYPLAAHQCPPAPQQSAFRVRAEDRSE